MATKQIILVGIWSAKPSHLYELISNIDHGKILVIIIITLIITFFIKIIPEQGWKHERGTAKDYQRPQPAEQVVLMNRDDDENNDYAGAALRFWSIQRAVSTIFPPYIMPNGTLIIWKNKKIKRYPPFKSW